MGKINLSPQALTFIINSMDGMKRELDKAAQVLKTDTNNIQTKWNDEQFDLFKSTMVKFHKDLTSMSELIETEKSRLKELQSDAIKTARKYNKDFNK
jgi:uncharacterized protein YukE